MKLILASASHGRKTLLTLLKVPFEVIPSTIDEDSVISTTPLETIKLRAKVKGEDVYKQQITDNRQQKESIILSADSGAIIDNQLIGKPKDYDDAVRILSLLSGKTHQFVTSVWIIVFDQNGKKEIIESVAESFVTFKKLSKEDIIRYLSITEYTRYAGGYAIAASPQDFITEIKGSLSNVIGLPLENVIPLFVKNKILQ